MEKTALFPEAVAAAFIETLNKVASKNYDAESFITACQTANSYPAKGGDIRGRMPKMSSGTEGKRPHQIMERHAQSRT